jgi:hypothetical protein
MSDGFVKRLSAALRGALPRFSAGQAYCSVLLCTPHSSGLARLASEPFYCAVLAEDFWGYHVY